jgi:hypothetical protein
MRTIRRLSFALAVAAALGFGATTAVAVSPDAARPCPLIAIGTCGNLARCQDMCRAAGGDVTQARCDNGCCICPGAGV